MSKPIFSYALCDAWGNWIRKIAVYDRVLENVLCSDDEFEIKYTLPESEIKKIYEIIIGFPFLISEQKILIEEHMVIDGTINAFSFNAGDKEFKVRAFNLWYYENNSDKAPNAAVLLSAFKNISDVLIENGVDLRFLKLE